MSNNLINVIKIGYMTLLFVFLSLFWVVFLPQLTKTVQAVTVTDPYDFDDDCMVLKY